MLTPQQLRAIALRADRAAKETTGNGRRAKLEKLARTARVTATTREAGEPTPSELGRSLHLLPPGAVK